MHIIERLNVFMTEDYSKFRYLLGNRDVLGPRKREILRSIQIKGWIPNPIIVNEKMEIIEGQGRFEALKELGLPIEFYIRPGWGIRECQALNSAGKIWMARDYISSYAIQDKNGWPKYKALMEEFGFNERIVGAVLHKTIRKDNVISEQLDVTDKEYERARIICGHLEKYAPALKRFKGQNATKYDAAIYMIEHNVDTDKMVEVINEMTVAEFNSSTKETMLKSFQEAYNKGKRKKENRIFVYESYRKGE